MSAHLYVEGGESKEDQIRCREGFRKLFEKAGFSGRMPRLSACGGRGSVFDDFKTAYALRKVGDYIAMLVDSEEPVEDLERTWEHLNRRDQWDKPVGASDEQVLFMTTCMETWIVTDRRALQEHYGHSLQENALPPLTNLENRNRHEVHDKLVHASRNCANAYRKGKRSFELLAKLDPAVLKKHLPSFVRVDRILKAKL
ncbi:MAG: DUF4276 family protein [Candidatus Accumulibacter phosphatis]|uniref:DUF4276 family protein n=1 Tax=Candidatus Accumulibacter contiguus TaxID=2954381 RepID=UPI0027E3AC02|nr:DUF4276 family protein [Candidatus Accumulibacter contiguus]HRF12942.1 DUF4276 family protein [Candidatus Accumulibacter phosphatis]